MAQQTVRLQERKIGFTAYLRKYWFLYVLAVPGIAFLAVFSYGPMYGLLLAFKDLNMGAGILKSPWAGLDHFKTIFSYPEITRAIMNTLAINALNLLFGFTFVIFLALMLNELRFKKVKSVAQTFVYLPYFLSWIVFSGIIQTFLAPDYGLVNSILAALGKGQIVFLSEAGLYRWILVVANIIKTSGYSTIIYLAAIAGVSPELYESAKVDGANRFHMIRHITLPRIVPTIAVLLILQLAGMFSANFDMVYTTYSPMVFETGDVISTYIYRVGIGKAQYEVGTAMGLVFNGLSFLVIIAANKLIRKMDVMGIF
ncbi:MAG: ABC transporter permease subunit [Oscillospiraceae bacterium]|nr:ABC transporter permease subunit [Oscillospiraceae bacterium]